MESTSKYKKYTPTKKLKQIKVDNWGTFFLQRLLQLYFNEELLDFNIKFHSNGNILKVSILKFYLIIILTYHIILLI